MEKVSSFIRDPAAADVEVASVFSEAMFEELTRHVIEGTTDLSLRKC